MIHILVRKALKWFCELTDQQCSGKRKNGYATEWCQRRAFHHGTCKAHNGEEFSV